MGEEGQNLDTHNKGGRNGRSKIILKGSESSKIARTILKWYKLEVRMTFEKTIGQPLPAENEPTGGLFWTSKKPREVSRKLDTDHELYHVLLLTVVLQI